MSEILTGDGKCSVNKITSDDSSVDLDPSSGVGCVDLSVDISVVESALWSHQSTVTPTGTSQSIDWSLGNCATIDLGSATGDVTVTFSNWVAGRMYYLYTIQGSTARQIVLSGVQASYAITPELTSVNDSVSLITMSYDGTTPRVINFLRNYE